MILSVDERRAIAARATSVYERVARARTAGRHAADERTVASAMSAWNQAFAPGDADAFARRLSWDGLTPDLVAAAASCDVDEETLAWTDWLERFNDAAISVARDLRRGDLAELATLADREPPFVEIWIAVLRAARAALDARLSSPLPLTAAARAHLERQLLRELSTYGELAVAEAYKDHTGEGRYRAFTLVTLDDGFAALWTTYPVLARQVVTVVEGWIGAAEELIMRLAVDRERIAEMFSAGRHPGAVVAIDPALSDPHDGRRRVAILQFESGLRLVYKPRDLRVEAAFVELVKWLDARGFTPAVAAPRVIEGDGYGWVEFVEQQTFESADAVREYFRQAGALLFLTHLLGSKDLHMENVVATRRGPMLIDLEMLLQPGRERSGYLDVERSVLKTGLLSLVEVGPDEEPYEIGGLRGGGAMPLAESKRVWRNLRTDDVSYDTETSVRPVVGNGVVLDGRLQTPDAHADELIDGFTRAYTFAMAHRDEMEANGGPLPAFRSGVVRVLARPTNQYALLSAVCNTPRYQRDGLVRSMIADVLVRPLNAARERPREWPIIVEERRAIEALDVPRLVVGTDSRAVSSAGRMILDDCYQRAPLDAARDRLSLLSPDDCAAQCRALRRTLGESISTRFTVAAPAQADDFAAHAEWIGRELLAHAKEKSGSLVWTDAPLDSAAAHYLYDGTLGPALFFAALAATTGEESWRRAARQALAPALTWAETAVGGDGEPLAIGGCSGLGSIVYGLACAGSLAGEPRALDAASRVATWIDADRIAGDRRFDIVDGAAGALLGVLALHASTRNQQLLETAQLCGEHLLAFHDDAPAGWAWPTDDGRQLVGFAHGAAGIATALIRLDTATGCSVYSGAASEALAFVSGAFAPGVASWPIAAGDSDDLAAVAGRMNAWCHGAPGICLAAASALEIATEVDFLTQARSAAGRVARWDANQADHLCCGHFGRVDVLLTAGVRLVGSSAADAARQIAARVVERARRLRHFRLSTPGFEYRVFDAGLFRGLSGIGYELLRLTAPARLPSLLSFEPAER